MFHTLRCQCSVYRSSLTGTGITAARSAASPAGHSNSFRSVINIRYYSHKSAIKPCQLMIRQQRIRCLIYYNPIIISNLASTNMSYWSICGFFFISVITKISHAFTFCFPFRYTLNRISLVRDQAINLRLVAFNLHLQVGCF